MCPQEVMLLFKAIQNRACLPMSLISRDIGDFFFKVLHMKSPEFPEMFL
jgi:hypothetical protein